MKTRIVHLSAALLLVLSCSVENRSYLQDLDRAIEQKEEFDLSHERLQDWYRLQFRVASTDSARWEAAYSLEKIFFYHDVDSCYH